MKKGTKNRTLMAAVLMIAAAAGGSAHGEDRLALSPLPAMNPANPAATFVMIEESQDGSRRRFPVTDIQLDIVRRQGSAYDALTSPDKPGREAFREVFLAHLLVVARGRLYRDGYGLCSAWENDISVCGIECDGGQFLLRRKLGKTTHSVTLILRPLPELFSEGGDDSAEIRIGDCDGEGGSIYLDAAGNRPAHYSFSTWAVNPE